MKKPRRYNSWKEVLVYRSRKASPSTVRRYYQKWREEQKIPSRCDIPNCIFHTQQLEWNGMPLPLILDHVEGNNRDNRPEMLRYLCPNCDAQQATKGGKNKGRVISVTDNSFILQSQSSKARSYTYFASGDISFGGSADVEFISTTKKRD